MHKAKAAAAGVQGLRAEHTRTIEPARALAAEALARERTLSDLVNQTYALTLAEIELRGKPLGPGCRSRPPRDVLA